MKMKNGLIIDEEGTKRYYLNDNLHREDGHAIEFANGTKYWYLNGNLHREDGHAIEFASGEKYWFLNDKEYTEEEFNKLKQNNMKQEFEIPEGCKKFTIEQIGNKIITTFKQEGRKRVEKGTKYWYMDAYLKVNSTCETGSKWDDLTFNCGNYYLTPDDPELIKRIEMNKNFNLCKPENNV